MSSDRVAEWREVLTADGNTPFAPLAVPLLEGDWETRADGFWLHARTIGGASPIQGWKLHVSAVPRTAAQVLAACVPVLREHRVAFKCAEDMAVLLQLLSSRYEAGGLGKFLTAYPPDADACVTVGDLLAEATAGLPGPPVISDAAWRPDSPVHYRYGGFTGEDRLTDDGRLVPVLIAPDGTAERDVRDRFAPPSWAPSLPRPKPARARGFGGAPVVAGRYRVRSVLRRSARGGVFTGQDLTTGRPVVIKHARAHVGVTPDGHEARDVLRHEARVLRALSRTGVVPGLVDFVETEQAAYLVEERVDGSTLYQLVTASWRPGRSVGETVWQVATSLADAVAAVHAAGWTLCDLSPGNVMVGPGGRCTLIDLELAARPGDLVLRDNTLGYAAPEQHYAALVDRAPGSPADCHALGGLLFLLAAGRDPLHLNGMWSAGELLAGQLAALRDRQGFAVAVAPLVEALMREDPQHRPTAAEAANRLTRPGPSAAAGGARASATPVRGTCPDPSAVLADGIGELVDRVRAHGPGALRLDAPWRGRRDSLGADFGVCGPLLLLTRAMAAPSSLTGADPTQLHDAVRRTADHVRRQPWPQSLTSGPRLGLATGEAGRLWALWDAAEVLRDQLLRDRLLTRAAELAGAVVPLAGSGGTGTRLSLGHGVAGLGTLLLRLYLATGCTELRTSALACADALIAANAAGGPPQVERPWTDGAPTGGLLAGPAGVAWFLLALGHALGHAPAVQVAREAANRCAAQVMSVAEAPDSRLAHHDGLAGEGRLLAAAARHGITKGKALRRIEDAIAARHSTAPTGFARGLSGWTEFLLDVGSRSAEHLITAIAARANVRYGRITVPDDSGGYANHTFADGGCGPLWVLLRAADAGPGLWDPAPGRAAPAPPGPDPATATPVPLAGRPPDRGRT
ncbi:class III lanthionine synthetase LanKC N-terminal domain-containing protein [Streptomyces sp. CB02460]|uniref:class III lanthionine synthetase LanKC N-terminal domain-containing protein n=1 Tax=Streptomyces sp. CB02460 TaxID=1703941 RepID=UPI000938DF94|nr:lanthionine synthetase LanC family protein [Streptomyces sp. CB02460]OKJ72764.1 hypothetical protein AMK30_17515 [Streptomyces sp. CB02460]